MIRNEVFNPFEMLNRFFETVGETGSAVVPMDVYRRDGAYTLLLDLPGLDPQGIDLSIESGVLTINAERTVEESDDVQWVARERRAGALTRRVFLGEDLDLEAIQASYEDGVLKVSIPIKHGARPRRIEVGAARKSIGSVSAA